MAGSLSPACLYKYRDDSARTESIIADGKVWLSTAEKLNDPLECKTGQISPAWKRAYIKAMEDAQMSGFVVSAAPALAGEAQFYSLSPRAAKRWFKRLRSLKTRKEKYAAIHSFLRDQNVAVSRPSEVFDNFERQLANVGVFSLSDSPNNDLMWSLYAAGHAGLALGFGCVPGSKLTSTDHTLQVVYATEKPTFTNGFINQVSMGDASGSGIILRQKIGFSDPTFRAAFSTKPPHWSYEREWRYVEETSGLFAWPGPLQEVVFGAKMPVNRRRYYSDLVQRAGLPQTRFYEIKVAPNNNGFVIMPWSRPS